MSLQSGLELTTPFCIVSVAITYNTSNFDNLSEVFVVADMGDFRGETYIKDCALGGVSVRGAVKVLQEKVPLEWSLSEPLTSLTVVTFR